MFQNIDIFNNLSNKRKHSSSESEHQKRQKPSLLSVTYDTISVFVGRKWLTAKAHIQGKLIGFWNDRYNQEKPSMIKVTDTHGNIITKELIDDDYFTQPEDEMESSEEPNLTDDNLDFDSQEEVDEEFEQDPEDEESDDMVVYKSPLQDIETQDTPPQTSYKLPPPSELDKKFQEQKKKMKKKVDSSDDEEDEDDTVQDYDREEYAQAIRILTRYSDVASLKTTQSSSQMGHAGIQKRDKEFIILNASTFENYIEQLSTKLQDSKPTKRINLYMCNKKQYDFPEPKPWVLEAALDQPEVDLILDSNSLPPNKKIFTFYPKDVMTRMEAQMWAASGACSHLDHFLHGAGEATKQAMADLKGITVHPDQQAAMDSVITKLADAQKLQKVAGINNIQVAQSCITAGANHQLLRRDSILMHHHENLDVEDIRQLRSQPFGQKLLFGPIVESKAKVVTDHTTERAHRLIIENSSKQAEDAKKKGKGGQSYNQYPAPQQQQQQQQQQPQQYNQYPPNRGGYRGRNNQPRGRGFINAYGKDTSKFQSRGQPFRPRRNNNRGGFRPRGARGRFNQQFQ